MIDLHIHILPALDDGARSQEEALEMGRIAAADGIRTLVATPHATELEQFAAPYSEAQRRLSALQEALESVGVSVALRLGAELNLVADLPDKLAEQRLFPIAGGHYILLHWDFEPIFAEEVLFALQLQGFIPIIAHPERSLSLHQNPASLARLVEHGALVQVTASSLLGDHGPKVRVETERLLRQGLAHFIATDAHSAGRDRRAPYLAAAVEAAGRIVGREQAEAMVTTWPQAVLEGRRMVMEPAVLAGRRWWSFFRR